MTPHPTRRTALAGAGAIGVAGLATGCGTSAEEVGDTASAAASGAADAASSAADEAGDAASDAAAGAGAALAAAADVPVGGGIVVTDAEVVLTQPTEGEFKAFSAVCTHQGCLVASVTDGQIVCPCHGSHFDIASGDVLSGPANAPLPSKTVSVAGPDIMLG